MVLQYNKINKKTKDLLTKEFNTSKKVEVVTTTENNVKFTTTLQDNVSADLEVEWQDKTHGLVLKGKADNKSTLKLEASVENNAVEGLKATIETSNSADTAPDSIKTTVEFANKSVATSAGIDFVSRTACASAVLGYQGFAIGGQAELALENTDGPKSLNGTAAYSTAEYTLALSLTEKAKQLGISYLHNLRGVDATVAAEYTVSSEKNSFVVGGKYNLDKSSYVKARVNTEGLLSLVYSQSLRKNVNLTLSTDINTSNKPSEGQKVGLVLAFSDE
jgi:voltage-dependent anion channel protein 2